MFQTGLLDSPTTPTLAILGVYLLASVTAFVAFWIDKRAAGRGARRIPERALHTLELLGGWPGALAAQRVLRHKSSKASYRLTLLAIAIAHIAGWMLIAGILLAGALGFDS